MQSSVTAALRKFFSKFLIKGMEIIFRKIYVERARSMKEYGRSGKTNLQSRPRNVNLKTSLTWMKQDFSINVYLTRPLSFKGDMCHGGKMKKLRLAVLLGTNCTETCRLKPLIIGKYKPLKLTFIN